MGPVCRRLVTSALGLLSVTLFAACVTACVDGASAANGFTDAPASSDGGVEASVLPAVTEPTSTMGTVSDAATPRPDTKGDAPTGDAGAQGEAAADDDGDVPEGADGAACSDGMACNGPCTQTATDVHNCGACGHDCTTLEHVTGAACVAGACTYQCEPGHADCAGAGLGCTTSLSQASSCGACATSCSGAAPVCSPVGSTGDYACASGCAARQELCEGTCTTTSSDPDNCGQCNTRCAVPSNGRATCDGRCGMECNGGYHACGEACANDSSVDSCGASCTACAPPANATATCNGVACGFACDSGYHACGETCAKSSSIDSCGASCTACVPPANATATCNGVACGFTCDTGFHACASGCCGVSEVSVGGAHACAISRGTGALACWGWNSSGQLGTGTTTDSEVPLPVLGLSSGVAMVSAGDSHTCAITSYGGVECWGDNTHGALGTGTTTSSNVPVPVLNLDANVKAIAAGSSFTCALTTTGSVLCWGENPNCDLGSAVGGQATAPTALSLPGPVTAIAAGGDHACALTQAGGVECWGDNVSGQLGNGSTSPGSCAPVPVTGLASGVVAITTGTNHTCALTSAGGAECWGSGTSGELGNGLLSNRSTPTAVTGLGSGVSSIAAGGDYTCAVVNGGVKCWGYNAEEQLGDGSSLTRDTPVASGPTSGVRAVAAGGQYTCSLTVSGSVGCAGTDGMFVSAVSQTIPGL